MIRTKLISAVNKVGRGQSVLAIQKRTAVKFRGEDFTLEYLENVHKGVAVGTMTRVKTRNALSKSLIAQFKAAIDMLEFEKSISALVLRSSAPKVFCSGADLKERLQMTDAEVVLFVASLRQLASNISDLPIPTIAAIDGAALGGGLEYALSCDLRVASDNAKMGLVETSLAIIPGAGGTQKLPRLVGPSVAKDLIFTSKIIDGNHAYKIGLVNYMVPQNDNGDAAYLKALEVAGQISGNGPIALRMAKAAIDRGYEVDLKSGLAYEQAYYAQVVPTKDRIEALKAFQEKRPKHFTGE